MRWCRQLLLVVRKQEMRRTEGSILGPASCRSGVQPVRNSLLAKMKRKWPTIACRRTLDDFSHSQRRGAESYELGKAVSRAGRDGVKASHWI